MHKSFVTAGQLFDLDAPEIIIQDNDQIDIQIIPIKQQTSNLLWVQKEIYSFQDVGSISAVNRL